MINKKSLLVLSFVLLFPLVLFTASSGRYDELQIAMEHSFYCDLVGATKDEVGIEMQDPRLLLALKGSHPDKMFKFERDLFRPDDSGCILRILKTVVDGCEVIAVFGPYDKMPKHDPVLYVVVAGPYAGMLGYICEESEWLCDFRPLVKERSNQIFSMKREYLVPLTDETILLQKETN